MQGCVVEIIKRAFVLLKKRAFVPLQRRDFVLPLRAFMPSKRRVLRRLVAMRRN